MTWKAVWQWMRLYAALLSIFLVAMIGASVLPASWLTQTVSQSVHVLEREGLYPSSGLPFRQIALDNFTDALMLNTAYTVDEENILKTAFLNQRAQQSPEEMNQIQNLAALSRGQTTGQVTYERYWHGYLVFLRPALVLLPYDSLRLVLWGMSWLSFGWLFLLTWKKSAPLRALALLVAALATDFFSLSQSLQFSSVYLIGIFSGVWYLTRKKEGNLARFLFTVGALTSFFDLLTAPFVTLGILLIVAASPQRPGEVFRSILAWGTGYLLLWMSKWVLLEWWYAPGSFQDALGHVLNRTVHEADANFSRFRTLQLNVQQLIGYAKSNKIFALVLATSSAFFVLLFQKKWKDIAWSTVFFWLGLALLPYIWYLIAANHSYLHVWYTYRAQFLTVGASALVFAELIDWSRVRRMAPAAAQRRKNGLKKV